MNIYVYTDESGVFDKIHNNFFVYGGILFLSNDEKENFTRKYIHAEQSLRKKSKYKGINELKASVIDNSDKSKLFRSTNKCFRFGVVILENKLLDQAFENKKSKQRYLDYAFKICLRRYFEFLIDGNEINRDDVRNIYVFCDQHSTSTNSYYGLDESIRNEFRDGIYNSRYNKYIHPIFPNLENVIVKYCDSQKTTLIRSADIIANRIYYYAHKDPSILSEEKFLYITTLP